jgi:glycosyltransferase involved in cell wall biosynthesis
MRISVDFTSAIGDRTGIGTYTRELVRAIVPRLGGDRLTLAVNAYRHPGWHQKLVERLGPAARDVDVRVNRLVPHGLLLRMERLFGLPPAEALFGPADVFHGTNFLVPPCRRARPVITVHDLAFVTLRDEIPVPHRYHLYIEASVRRARRIIAVSEATRRDVLSRFEVPEDRVVTIHEGAPEELPSAPPEVLDAFLSRLGLPGRFFLFVGTLEPRKNLPRLVRAFGRAATLLTRPTGLLLLGRRGWALAGLDEEIGRCPAPVAAPGFVNEAMRNAALKRALGLLLPSLHEGFGLPVLEAFRAGTPVLTADAGALPEVAGDAAMLVNPHDEEAIVDGLVRIGNDAGIRRTLVSRGSRRVERFSWDRAAEATLSVYRDA